PLKLPVRQQPPLVYRDRGEATPPVFAATLAVHERQVSLDLENQVVFTAREAQIEQRFRYHVVHSGLQAVRFSLPAPLAEGAKVELLPEHRALSVTPVAGAKAGTGRTVLQAVLPAPARLGVVELLVRYNWALAGLEPGRRSVVAV